ncbi:uncharacterized protein LOC129727024 [Wyeomyia smithii]|uniref:uncharacterized protein LOC129727024 n=1 Tax=Wyeomyia smithii TaxID=174621 RepID=UPI002467F64C|nr:uncharacterized protein LOC129727024 [Wyeomyia smithii]XP_055540365.1 uncharacterized protein LOC129727024 [Wyeomyia smithii]XP_055540366.1 uncharacterized protein LOC129727024 [Wyeomyia smithii]XP_055540367.1 uncharacterized protein LOC129727024 [Wyeomyia smithii]
MMRSVVKKINRKLISMNKLICAICSLMITLSAVSAEHDYFPGLRRIKPNQVGHPPWTSSDGREAPEFLKILNELIEEQARRRFLEHLQRFQLNRNILQRPELDDFARPVFTYQLPLRNDVDIKKPIEFAVDPSDPRYYENGIDLNPESGSNIDIDIKTVSKQAQEALTNLPPSPQIIKPKLPLYPVNKQLNVDSKIKYKDDDMLQRINGVIQRPVDMNGTMAMYIVALIGGISAAITVGLISVGIGWYTLHKKAKAAADVDYPAYGVTGPNKDSSPAGDRKLAQSAQMYHYQHQKQQIIAMENHNLDKSAPHSDPESEDDNEEGDYTVYECPGLAPTGEMEVKNPMFLDDSALTTGNASPSAAVHINTPVDSNQVLKERREMTLP